MAKSATVEAEKPAKKTSGKKEKALVIVESHPTPTVRERLLHGMFDRY